MIVITACLTAVGVSAQMLGFASSFGWLTIPVNHNLLMGVGATLCAAASKLTDDTIATGICTACAVLQFALWWNNRGGGNRLKKAARELGDKGRALVQSLVDALSPAPQGAGV